MRWLDRRYTFLGGSLRAPIALLIGATLASSILGAQVPGVLEGGVLVTGAVYLGQAWRLVTWVLFEQDPLSLIFAALALFWFGNELVRLWGPGRFLAAYFGLAASAGLVTCAAALAFAPLRAVAFLGPWTVVTALIVAWAICFPTRDVFVYFVLPLHGRNLVYATLAGTLLFALLGGGVRLFPHFAAQLITLVALRGSPFSRLWARARFELAYRSWRRRASRLKEVPPPPRDESSRWYH
ncbi:MAG TPA: rhomboid family intramembrane serine protease [Vicinamibacteria bacterium]|nr:rhomboid family intramembrane serine protease [Vicinamibacteria bacterium]